MKRAFFSSLGFVALLVACSGGGGTAGTNLGQDPGASGGFSVRATDTASAPAGSKVVVLWSVSSGSPDYLYAFGSGTLNGSQVSISFPSSPPEEALNGGVLGIGLLAVIDGDLPEGRVQDFDESKVRALSAHHAVVYRANASGSLLETGWDASFPVGFACGRCVPKEPDSESPFDSFAVEDCSKIELEPAGARVCNWT